MSRITNKKNNKKAIFFSVILFLISLTITIIAYQNYVETSKEVEIARQNLEIAEREYQKTLDETERLYNFR